MEHLEQKSLYIPRDLYRKAASDPLLNGCLPKIFGRFSGVNDHYMMREYGAEEHILIYCLAGKGWVSSGEKHQPVIKGDLLLIPAHLRHEYGADPEDPWSIYWCHATGEFIEECSRRISQRSLNPVDSKEPENYAILPSTISPQLLSRFQEMFKIAERSLSMLELLKLSELYRSVLLEALQLQVTRSETVSIIDAVYHYFEEHLHESITLEELASQVSMSKYHFSRVFSQQTGMSPIECFIRFKMQYACSLLDTENSPISEIAAVVGYQDPYYFSRIFKKMIGYSPQRYRLMEKG